MFGVMKFKIMETYTQGILEFKVPIINLFEEADESDFDYGLVEYGIFQEKSDIRAHVTNKYIFVFKTIECLKYISENKNKLKTAYANQPNCEDPTGYGYLIKPDMINNIRKLQFNTWNRWHEFNNKWSTSKKGTFAVDCVIELIRLGRFPFWLEVKQNDNIKIDIQGTDILVVMNQRIQVKCDYPIIESGNLFIQIKEKNPLKLH